MKSMKRFSYWIACVVTLGFVVPAAARAGEESVKAADVPKAVTDAMHKKYPKADIKGYTKELDKGILEYEVKIEVKAKVKDGDKEKEITRSIDVSLTADGKIVDEEEALDPKALPAMVTKAIAGSKYAGKTIKKAERLVKGENEKEPVYELHVVDGEKTCEVLVDKDGKVSEAEEDEDDEKDGKGDDDESGKQGGDMK